MPRMTLATSTDLANGFTFSNALAALLTTEGLLFAALALTANLSVGGGRRIRRLPVSGQKLGAGAVTALVVVALGAAAAWAEIFARDFPSASAPLEIFIAITLLVAIVVQPVLAVLIGLGLRTAE